MRSTGVMRTTAGRTRVSGRPARVVGLLVLALVALFVAPAPAQATSYVPISGSGSTWDENAINQWTGSVSQYGMEVNYAGTGSSAGRTAFRGDQADFAASDIPYGESDDNVVDPPPTAPKTFAYMPVVAGGTSFMYNLEIGGRRVTNLRLSGQTLTKIFTANITQWNDPEIAAENPGLVLPAREIVPVVRTDGSGSSAQLTAWMAATYPNIWNPYCKAAGRYSTPCGSTSLYPVLPNSAFISQSLDSGVAGYVAQSTSDGAITYTEYSYALQAGFPVAAMLNSAGYYVLPTQYNVAVALNQAQINHTSDPNTNLTQNLSGVYSDTDPRTYPLSSYSYFIIPTSTAAPFNTGKGATLSAFAYYLLCQGQQPMGALGYSPLPINLVEAGFEQIKKIPGANVQNINISSCNNPTFSTNGTNTLADTAPQPPACAKAGPTQCVSYSVANPVGTGGGGSSGGGAGAGAGGAGGTATAGPSAGASAAGAGAGAVNPDTGQVANAGGGAGATLNPNIYAEPVSISSTLDGAIGVPLMAVAAVFLLGSVFGPPVVWRYRRRRRKS